MKRLMRAPVCLLLLSISTPLLTSCDESNQPKARAVVLPHVAAVLSEKTPAARKAAIRRHIAAVCPTPLSDDELEWAAEVVEENRSKGVGWLAGRVLKMNRETRICRGL